MAQIEQIVFFDGTCNFCNSTVDILFSRRKHKNLYFASLQSEFAAEFLPKDQVDLSNLDTIYYYRNGKLYDRSEAVLRVSRELKGLYPLLQLFLLFPGFLRDAVYDLVARNRYRIFGKKDTCRIATEEERASFLETSEDYHRNSFPGEEKLRSPEVRKIPSPGFTVVFLVLMMSPYFIYMRYGAEMEPYPAVILPSGAGICYRDSSSLTYGYTYLYGENNRGNLVYLNPEEFLFPLPPYYVGHIQNHIAWMDSPPEQREITGLLQSWMADKGMIRNAYRPGQIPGFAKWLGRKLSAYGMNPEVIHLEYHQVTQELEGDRNVRDTVYKNTTISLK